MIKYVTFREYCEMKKGEVKWMGFPVLFRNLIEESGIIVFFFNVVSSLVSHCSWRVKDVIRVVRGQR